MKMRSGPCQESEEGCWDHSSKIGAYLMPHHAAAPIGLMIVKACMAWPECRLSTNNARLAEFHMVRIHFRGSSKMCGLHLYVQWATAILPVALSAQTSLPCYWHDQLTMIGECGHDRISNSPARRPIWIQQIGVMHDKRSPFDFALLSCEPVFLVRSCHVHVMGKPSLEAHREIASRLVLSRVSGSCFVT